MFLKRIMDEFIKKKPWYQKPLKIILLIFGLAVIGITIAFLILLGYYLWNIRYGDSTELTKRFNNHFTYNTETNLQIRPKVEKDINLYIKDHNPILDNNAPITIIAFIDFECPFCQEAYPTFNNVMQRYGPAVNIVFKHYPISSIHPNALPSALASSCAQDQDKFWEYYHLLFRTKKLEAEYLNAYAKELNLDLVEFQKCMVSQKNRINIEEDIQDGTDLEVRGTPTYFVNQIKIEGVTSLQDWDLIIARELQNNSL
jgi:protein-disulfide isomerase